MNERELKCDHGRSNVGPDERVRVEAGSTTQTWLPGNPTIPAKVWCYTHLAWEPETPREPEPYEDGLIDDASSVLDRSTRRSIYALTVARALNLAVDSVTVTRAVDAVMTTRDRELCMLRQRLQLATGNDVCFADEMTGEPDGP